MINQYWLLSVARKKLQVSFTFLESKDAVMTFLLTITIPMEYWQCD